MKTVSKIIAFIKYDENVVIGSFSSHSSEWRKLDIGDELSKNILKFYNESGKDLIDKAKDNFIEKRN